MTSTNTRESIQQMLSSRSVAVVGASDDERKVGYRPVFFLKNHGFAGSIYPVNPRLQSCLGLPCFNSLADLPECPDLVVIVVSATAAPGILQEAGKLGVRNAIVMSSGFSEIGEEGHLLQNQLKKIADQYSIAICGPNSVGIVHTPTNLVASFSEALTRGPLPPGSLGVVSQSGAYGTILLAEARFRGLGIHTYISSGNEAGVGLGAYLGALVDDPGIRVVGGYVEGISDGTEFKNSMELAMRLGKPVVLLKAGRSLNGSDAAASHTGALAGRDEAYEAAFKKFGVIRASNDAEFIDILEAFNTVINRPSGGRVVVVSMSGGAGVLISDLLSDVGLEMAKLSEDTNKRLRQLLPSFASISNPVDLTGQFVVNGEKLGEVLQIIARDHNVDILIVYTGLAWQTEEQWIGAAKKAVEEGVCVVAVRAILETKVHEKFQSIGVPLYASGAAAVRVADALVRWREAQTQEVPNALLGNNITQEMWPKALSDLREYDVRQNRERRARVLDLLKKRSGYVGEDISKKVLMEMGLNIPIGSNVYSPGEAALLAAQIGDAVVVKADISGVLHKSDIGGVKIGIEPRDVAEVFTQMEQDTKQYQTKGSKFGVRIEEMVRGGSEFLIGALRADPFGIMVAVGRGGIESELYQDIAFEIAPVSYETASKMISSLKCSPLLYGYRKSEQLDISALIDAICRISELAMDLGDQMEELDCNPVLVRRNGEGIVILDAALIVAEKLPK